MAFEGIVKTLGEAFTNPVTYWVLAGFFSVLVFLVFRTFTDLSKTYAGVAALILPVVVLEFGLKAFFGIIGAPVSFGSYSLTFPFLGAVQVTEGVMLLRFLDFVFNFGLFRLVGLPVLNDFISGVPATMFPAVGLSGLDLVWNIFLNPFNFLVFVYVNGDAIIEYVFFHFLFLAVLILGADLFGVKPRNAKGYALAFAVIPVLVYMALVSNPFEEYKTALPALQKVFYFLANADNWSIAVFLIALAISFGIVMEILAAAVGMFYSAGASTFRPSWETKHWETSVQGMGFLFTVSFAVMYALHQFEWYIFFPALVIYSLFKKVSGQAIQVAKTHEEKREMQEYLGNIVGEKQAERGKGIRERGESGGSVGGNKLIYVLVGGIIVLSILLLKNLGLV